MHASRTLLAFLASSLALGSAAIAAPPLGVGVGVGSHGAAGVGAPPIGVPPAHVPPMSVPPVSVPKPQVTAAPRVNANAGVRANAQSSVIAGNVFHGTVTGVSGTTVTIASGDGTTRTYTVSAQTAARLESYLNKTIAFHVQNGGLSLIGQGTPPLRGTLTALNGTSAQVRLANGTTQTYTVTAQQAAWLHSHVGTSIAFWTNANGSVELDQSAHRAHTSHHGRSRKH